MDRCLWPQIYAHVEDTVLDALFLGRTFGLPRLEDQSVQWIAEHLDEMVEDADFSELVLADAAGVEGRQEVDSIDIVDNVRYHLTANSIDEAHDRLELIDNLLERLGLDA